MASIRHLISVLLLNLTLSIDKRHISGTTTLFSRDHLDGIDFKWVGFKTQAGRQTMILDTYMKTRAWITVDWNNQETPEGPFSEKLFVTIRLNLYFFFKKSMPSDEGRVVFDIEETRSSEKKDTDKDMDWSAYDFEVTPFRVTKDLYEDETNDCVRLEYEKKVVLPYLMEDSEEKPLTFDSSQEEITIAFSSPLEVRTASQNNNLMEIQSAKISTRTKLELILTLHLDFGVFNRLGSSNTIPQLTANLHLNKFNLPLKVNEEERLLVFQKGHSFRFKQIDSEDIEEKLARVFLNINQTLLFKSKILREEYNSQQTKFREKGEVELLGENFELRKEISELKKINELEAKASSNSNKKIAMLEKENLELERKKKVLEKEEMLKLKRKLKVLEEEEMLKLTNRLTAVEKNGMLKLDDRLKVLEKKIMLNSNEKRSELEEKKILLLEKKYSKPEAKIISESREKVQKILSLQNYNLRLKIKELENGENPDTKKMLEELVQKELVKIRKKAKDLETKVRKKNEQIEDMRRDLADANFDVLMLKGEREDVDINSLIPAKKS